MPFKSKAQMKAAYGGYLGEEMKSKAPQWAKETSDTKGLPEKKSMGSMARKRKGKSCSSCKGECSC